MYDLTTHPLNLGSSLCMYVLFTNKNIFYSNCISKIMFRVIKSAVDQLHLLIRLNMFKNQVIKLKSVIGLTCLKIYTPKWILLENTVVGDYINILQTNFDFNFDLYQAFKQHEYTKTWNKDKLSIKKAHLLLLNLYSKISLLTIKIWIKSCFHYIDIIAYHGVV